MVSSGVKLGTQKAATPLSTVLMYRALKAVDGDDELRCHIRQKSPHVDRLIHDALRLKERELAQTGVVLFPPQTDS